MQGWLYKLTLMSSIILSGCDYSDDSTHNDDISCTDEYVSGITIEVIDKVTGDYIACDVTAVIEDNGYSEEVTSFNSGECDNTQLLQGAGERSGIYDIHIFKEGYLDWSVYNIEVTSDICHVTTVHVVAQLEK